MKKRCATSAGRVSSSPILRRIGIRRSAERRRTRKERTSWRTKPGDSRKLYPIELLLRGLRFVRHRGKTVLSVASLQKLAPRLHYIHDPLVAAPLRRL